MSLISGYVVLRKPEEYYHRKQKSVSKYPPVIDLIYYGGINRNAWDDLVWMTLKSSDAEPFTEQMRDEAIAMRSQLDEQNNDNSIDLYLTQDLQFAREVLDFLRRSGNDRNEIIALRSTAAEEDKGIQPIEAEVEWLGIDVFVIGEWWSLLEMAMIDIEPESVRPFLNENGLIPDTETAKAFERDYRVWEQDEKVEPVEGIGVDVVTGWIGRPV